MKKFTKTQYRLRNWSEYNAALKRRGSLTVWFDEAIAEGWYAKGQPKRRGVPVVYSDLAIATMAVLGRVFGQPGRQASGLAESVLQLMGLELAVPDPSTVSRRLSAIAVELPVKARAEQAG
jgi:hypothetical protein